MLNLCRKKLKSSAASSSLIYSFMVYLTMFSVAQVTCRRIMGSAVINELDTMWEEVAVA
jgi:hypothetical protein